MDLGHKYTIYKLKFGWLKFGKAQTIRQIFQTFPLYGIKIFQLQWASSGHDYMSDPDQNCLVIMNTKNCNEKIDTL